MQPTRIRDLIGVRGSTTIWTAPRFNTAKSNKRLLRFHVSALSAACARPSDYARAQSHLRERV